MRLVYCVAKCLRNRFPFGHSSKKGFLPAHSTSERETTCNNRAKLDMDRHEVYIKSLSPLVPDVMTPAGDTSFSTSIRSLMTVKNGVAVGIAMVGVGAMLYLVRKWQQHKRYTTCDSKELTKFLTNSMKRAAAEHIFAKALEQKRNGSLKMGYLLTARAKELIDDMIATDPQLAVDEELNDMLLACLNTMLPIAACYPAVIKPDQLKHFEGLPSEKFGKDKAEELDIYYLTIKFDQAFRSTQRTRAQNLADAIQRRVQSKPNPLHFALANKLYGMLAWVDHDPALTDTRSAKALTCIRQAHLPPGSEEAEYAIHLWLGIVMSLLLPVHMLEDRDMTYALEDMLELARYLLGEDHIDTSICYRSYAQYLMFVTLLWRSRQQCIDSTKSEKHEASNEDNNNNTHTNNDQASGTISSSSSTINFDDNYIKCEWMLKRAMNQLKAASPVLTFHSWGDSAVALAQMYLDQGRDDEAAAMYAQLKAELRMPVFAQNVYITVMEAQFMDAADVPPSLLDDSSDTNDGQTTNTVDKGQWEVYELQLAFRSYLPKDARILIEFEDPTTDNKNKNSDDGDANAISWLSTGRPIPIKGDAATLRVVSPRFRYLGNKKEKQFNYEVRLTCWSDLYHSTQHRLFRLRQFVLGVPDLEEMYIRSCLLEQLQKGK